MKVMYQAFAFADGKPRPREGVPQLDGGGIRTRTQGCDLPVPTLSTSLHCLRLNIWVHSHVLLFPIKMSFYSSYWQAVTPNVHFTGRWQTLSRPEELPRKEGWMPSRDICILAAGCSASCLRHLWVRDPWKGLKQRDILPLIAPLPASVPCARHLCFQDLNFRLWDGVSMPWCADDKVPCEPWGCIRMGEDDSWWLRSGK